jgi:hypothetical protein
VQPQARALRLNQGQGGIYMVGRLKDGLNSGRESVGLGLENSATAALDFIGPVGQSTEESAYLLADLGRSAEAGVGRHFGADPAPDMLVSIEIGTVRRQADQAEPQVRGSQVGAQGVAAARPPWPRDRPVTVPAKIRGPARVGDSPYLDAATQVLCSPVPRNARQTEGLLVSVVFYKVRE